MSDVMPEMVPDPELAHARSDAGDEVQFEPGGGCDDCCLCPSRRNQDWPYPCLPCSADVRPDGKDGHWIKVPPAP